MPPSLAASLPADVLARIFAATEVKNRYTGELESVLCFEERTRAESVNKHWRAALGSQPGVFTSLPLAPPPGNSWYRQLSAAEEAAAEARTLARLAALAACKPAVGTIQLDVRQPPSRQLSAAYMTALEALLSRQGGSSTLAFMVERSSAPAAPFLVKAAPFASFAGLHYECHGLAGVHLLLLPSAALPRLPHVRSLTVQSGVRTAITLSLPMPRLESITVWELDEELGPICADLVAIAKPPARRGAPPAPAPFPALTRLQLDAVGMKLDCSAMPALADMRLTLVFPEAQFKVDNPSALAALTSLDLTATTVFNDALLGEMGGGEMADTSVHSNWFSRLLGGGLPALRTLSLNISEPLNAPMKRALRQLSGLTALKLRCEDEEEDEGEEEEGERAPRQRGPTVDCKLLEGMTALQTLDVNTPACLANPSALARLPALRTLRCWRTAGLPTVAPHLTQVTCLELGNPSATELEDNEGACEALPGMTALRRLVLGGYDCVRGADPDGARLEAACQEHAEALQALAGHLPAGCGVEAKPPISSMRRW